MYIMAGLLVIGFIANFCVKAVDKRFHMKAEDEKNVDAPLAQVGASGA
jgi:hypothetical protein